MGGLNTITIQVYPHVDYRIWYGDKTEKYRDKSFLIQYRENPYT